MRALVEVDLVSSLEPKSNRPERRLNSRPRINGGIKVRGMQVENRTDDVDIWQKARAEPEINKSRLERRKGMEVSSASHQRRAKQSVGNADRGALDRNDVACDYVPVGFVKIESIVIREFSLEHYVAVHAKAHARPDSKVVGAGLRDIQGIQEYPNFHSLLSKREAWEQDN